MTITITPVSYNTNLGHRLLVDQLATEAGAEIDDITEIRIDGATATIVVYLRDDTGKPYLVEPQSSEIATKLIEVAL